MNYSKKLLEILADESFISPKTDKEYSKDLDEDLDYLLTGLPEETAKEIKFNVFPASHAYDLMTVINQLAWTVLHEREEHKRFIEEMMRELRSQINTVKGYKPDYEYNHEGEDLFTYIKD